MKTQAEIQQDHRYKRRAAGKCGYFGCDKKSGDLYYCAHHREDHRIRMQIARARAKASDA